ncbi:hypothetical protein KY334_04135 [Candidatus Woesearchaeota archaeon]|nr:hypothetical protein [Candidatus Woesearchaeota archaeon]
MGKGKRNRNKRNDNIEEKVIRDKSSISGLLFPTVLSLATITIPAYFYHKSKQKEEPKPVIEYKTENTNNLSSNEFQENNSNLEKILNEFDDKLDKAIGKYAERRIQYHGNKSKKFYIIGFAHNYINEIDGKVIEEIRPENVPRVQANCYKLIEVLNKDFNVKNLLCEGSEPGFYTATSKTKIVEDESFEGLIKYFSNDDCAAFTAFKATNPDKIAYYGIDSRKLLDDGKEINMFMKSNEQTKEALSYLEGQGQIKQAIELEGQIYSVRQRALWNQRTDQFFVNTLNFFSNPKNYTVENNVSEYNEIGGASVAMMGIGHVPRFVYLINQAFDGEINLILPKDLKKETLDEFELNSLKYKSK